MKYSNYGFQDFDQGKISERWREKLKSHQDILKTSSSPSPDIDHHTEQIDSTLYSKPYLSLVSILYLGFFWIAVDPKRQGYHDKIADTYVVSV